MRRLRACDDAALLELYQLFNRAPVRSVLGASTGIEDAIRALDLISETQRPAMALLDAIRHQDPAEEIKDRTGDLKQAVLKACT
jgi:hypothetical protein